MRFVMPPALWMAVVLFFQERNRDKVKLSVMSVFDGRPRQGRISDASEAVGLTGYSLDQKNDPKQDMSLNCGVQMFIDGIARMAVESLLWLAPECSSWVWVCWSTTGRRTNRPGGVPSSAVLAANHLAEFVARALLLATYLGLSAGGFKHQKSILFPQVMRLKSDRIFVGGLEI